MKLYGLTGLAGSGKDTAGTILSKMIDQECEAIATPMKNLVHTLFSVTEFESSDRNTKEAEQVWSISIEALQECADLYYVLGLDKYMEFPEAWDIWYKLLDIKLPSEEGGPLTINKSLRQVYQDIGTGWGRTTDADIWLSLFPLGKIATDVREDNESVFLMLNGYNIVEILNDRVTPVNAHSSEDGLESYRIMYSINNHSTMADLYVELKTMVDNDAR
jgi:hypothetical protein